MMNNRKK